MAVTKGTSIAKCSPKNKACAKDENDTRQKQRNVDSVHRQEHCPAFPVILLLKPSQHGTKDAETLQQAQVQVQLSEASLSKLIVSKCERVCKQQQEHS